MSDIFNHDDELDRLAGKISEEKLHEIADTHEDADEDDLFRQGVKLGMITNGGALPIWSINPIRTDENGEKAYGPECFFVGTRLHVLALLSKNAGK